MKSTLAETSSHSEAVKRALSTAVGMAWDGCHKIYILMDDKQYSMQSLYGYGDGSDASKLLRIRQTPQGREEALATLEEWYETSCGLRFVNTVTSRPGHLTEAYEALVEQFEEWE